MTTTALAAALLVGGVMGTLGHLAVPRGRVPRWVTVAVATGAALLGTIVARLAGIGVGEFSLVEFLIQMVFGATGIAIVAGTADRTPPERQDRPV
jgi:hypothetical protein